MNGSIFVAAIKNIKKNSLLLFSTMAASCLFISSTLMSLLLVLAVFAVVSLLALLDMTKPDPISDRFMRFITGSLAFIFVSSGFYAFFSAWAHYSKLYPLAESLHMPASVLVLIVGLICCIVGFYAMHTLSCHIVNTIARLINDKSPDTKSSSTILNLKRNWYFPISATAFFCLNSNFSFAHCASLIIVFIISITVSVQIPSLWDFVKKSHISLHIISILSALGICWSGQSGFYSRCNSSEEAQALINKLPAVPVDIYFLISVIGAVAALLFVYFYVLIFFKKLTMIFSETGTFKDIKKAEAAVYSILLIASILFVTFSFFKSQAFYGTPHLYDVIYNADSMSIVKDNAYFVLTHPENDIRQPLFAIFSAPFVAIPYLLSKLTNASASVQSMLLNYVQVFLLFVSNFLIAKMMHLKPTSRICFMLLTCSTYTYLLFILMMEQYIFAFSWLIFLLYLICENQRFHGIALWGAGGTLITSIVLLPFTSKESPLKNFKNWLSDIIKYGFEFIVVMLGFCRFDVILNLTARILSLKEFTGDTLSLVDKIYQYTVFIRNCFAAPNAGVDLTAHPHTSWQLRAATGISLAGVIIFLLVIVSAILNRDKKISLFSAGWAVFSVVMLVGVGWGSKENGLILYSLYFGWAFLVLLFQLVEKISIKLNIQFLLPVLSLVSTVFLAVINIPAIIELLKFAINYFPA